MAKNTQPVLKRCKTLGLSPAVLGYSKSTNFLVRTLSHLACPPPCALAKALGVQHRAHSRTDCSILHCSFLLRSGGRTHSSAFWVHPLVSLPL